jgi:hypothetical protein
MPLEKKQVLITVKTYPNPSKKYKETVCVAGIDLSSNNWIRLYPIPFRDLEEDRKFKKYHVIEVETHKAKDDTRPESYKVHIDSIKVIDKYDTKNNWGRRKEVVMPTCSDSLCGIYQKTEVSGKSLGMFKPGKIKFECKKVKIEDLKERQKCYSQQGFFDKQNNPIEPIPYDFRYSFFCHGYSECPGHNLLIIDWEIGQSFRSWRYKYRSESLLRFRKQFMVLGVFYPHKA